MTKALATENDLPNALVALCIECVALQRDERVASMTIVRDRLDAATASQRAPTNAAVSPESSQSGRAACLGRTAVIAGLILVAISVGRLSPRSLPTRDGRSLSGWCTSSGSTDSTGRLCFLSAKSPATRL